MQDGKKSYILDHCRVHCANAAHGWENLYEILSAELEQMDLEGMLKEKFPKVLYHHLPKVALAGCPNGCSQPLIKDIGIIGYVVPEVNKDLCTGCRVCVKTCLEKAIVLKDGPQIDFDRCLACGDCIRVCPAEALSPGEKGWKLYTGGRVGRHPRFAEFMGAEGSEETVAEWVKNVLLAYAEQGEKGERLTHFLERKAY